MGITIEGNERLSRSEIIAELKGGGLYYLAPVRRVDSDHVKNLMMRKMDDLSFISVNVKGSRAYIFVRERLDTPVSDKNNAPANLIASRDGIIKGLEISEGMTVVKLNSQVAKGDLLVSGAFGNEGVGIRYVRAEGRVWAETIYEGSEKIPFKYTKNVLTGNTKNRWILNIFGKDIKVFWGNENPYKYAERAENIKPFFFGHIKTVTLKEFKKEKASRTAAEAIKWGEDKLFGEVLSEIPKEAKITAKDSTHKNGRDYVEVTVKYTCLEDIARQSNIDKIDDLDYTDTNE